MLETTKESYQVVEDKIYVICDYFSTDSTLSEQINFKVGGAQRFAVYWTLLSRDSNIESSTFIIIIIIAFEVLPFDCNI